MGFPKMIRTEVRRPWNILLWKIWRPAAVWTMVVLKSKIVDLVEVQSFLLNVWAWMLEDPVEILDPVVGLPKNYALNPKGEEEEMVAS